MGFETIVGEGSRYVDLVLGAGRLAHSVCRAAAPGGSRTGWSSAATESSGRPRRPEQEACDERGFTPSGAGRPGSTRRKRVNYQLGLVLGEDEFRQDQFHHRERDHHATRVLHGYGTVSGWASATTHTNRRLHVRPGLAVDPAGRLICVPVEYCGR